MKKPLLFAVNASGIDSEKEGVALLNSLIPGLKPGAIEKHRLYRRTLFRIFYRPPGNIINSANNLIGFYLNPDEYKIP